MLWKSEKNPTKELNRHRGQTVPMELTICKTRRAIACQNWNLSPQGNAVTLSTNLQIPLDICYTSFPLTDAACDPTAFAAEENNWPTAFQLCKTNTDVVRSKLPITMCVCTLKEHEQIDRLALMTKNTKAHYELCTCYCDCVFNVFHYSIFCIRFQIIRYSERYKNHSEASTPGLTPSGSQVDIKRTVYVSDSGECCK